MNPKEKLVCILGNTYAQNFLSGGGASTGFSVVSDKRVYFRGTTYFVEGKKLKKMAEAKTVDVKDITGTSVTTFTQPLIIIISIILSILFFSLMCGAFYTAVETANRYSHYGRQNSGSAGTTWGIICLIATIAAPIGGALLYKSKKVTVLKIEYAGGCIGFDINWFPREESMHYQKQLRITKDKAIEESENITANAVTAAMSQMAAVQPVAVGAPVAAAPVSSADELIKYADLLEKGLISREEFDEIKAGILKK
jgi:hypothetical protein